MIADYRPTPRQISVGIDLLAVAMILSVAFALAGLTWRMAGHAGVGAITVPSADRPVAANGTLVPPAGFAPFGKSAVVDASQPTTIKAELKGIVFAIPASLSTAFIMLGNEPAKTYAIGDSLSGASIVAIRRDRVILNNGGSMEYLAFPDPTGSKDDPSSPTASPIFGGGSATPAPRPTAQPAPTPDAGAMISRLGATPTDKGYQVGANAPPGLQPGDVIRSVNGQAVTNPQAAQAAFAAAQQSGSAQISILRDGKTITLTVPTR